MKKAASILLVYCILVIQIGCTTTKYLSFQQTSEPKFSRDHLVLHTPKTTYYLYDYKFTEETLEGSLKSLADKKKFGVHVYTNLNFELGLGQDSILQVTIPKSNIETVKFHSLSIGKTALLALIVGDGILALYVGAMVMIYGL